MIAEPFSLRDRVALVTGSTQGIGRRTPLGRLGEPDDIALAVLYLASPAAAFVTGASLVADGGLSIALF